MGKRYIGECFSLANDDVGGRDMRPPKNTSAKRSRVPWGRSHPDWESVTIPVFMAYCSIAAALRSWNSLESKAIVTLVFREDYDRHIYSQAAQIFGRQIWKRVEYDGFVFEWSDKSFRDQSLAEKSKRGIFFSPPNHKMSDDEMLFSDAVIEIKPRARRHAEAALRRARLPVDEKVVDLLVSEPWSSLNSAFQDRRGPLQALERLRSLQVRNKRNVERTEPTLEREGPRLEDMHGFESALKWGRSLAKDLAAYKSGAIAWNEVDAGVLLSGPPGIGKTMFAGALANTCRVPLIYGSVSKWQEAGSLDAHLKAMRATFAEAQASAPSILFIDEVDTFGRRSQADHNSGYLRGVVTALLELLDGFVRREGVVVIAACNHPNMVDAAMVRAGRLDRHLELTLPDAKSRLGILKYHSSILLHGNDAQKFMFATEGFSGADIAQLVRSAKRSARDESSDLRVQHIIDQLPALIELPEEYLKALAFHEAGHALVGFEIGHEIGGMHISRFRTEGHTRELGRVDYQLVEPRVRTKKTYLDSIAVCLGGIAAEIEVFGSFSDGASGSREADLNRATDIATVIEGVTGMGHTLVSETLEIEKLREMRLYNAELRRHVHLLLEAEFARTRSVIRRQRPALNALADRLMETDTMTGDEVVQILKRNRQSLGSLAKPVRGAGT